MRATKLIVTGIAAVLIAGCDAPMPNEPTAPMLEIVDAVHGGGNEKFFWLPPLINPMPQFSGAFDGDADPSVEVCEGPVSGCDTPIVTFDLASGLAANAAEERYEAVWHVFDYAPAEGDIFRISVVTAGQVLGFADVLIADRVTGKVRNTQEDDYILLSENNGKKFLQIRFRIEDGAVLSGLWAGTTDVTDPVLGYPVSYPLQVNFATGAVAYEACANLGSITSVTASTITVNYPDCGTEVVTYSVWENTLTATGHITAVSDGRVIPTSWALVAPSP